MSVRVIRQDVAPGRWIQLREPQNVRDIGGYLTFDGGTVAWRRALRSDSLATASLADIRDLLDDVAIRTIIDVRSDAERRADPIAPPLADEVTVVHLPLVQWWQPASGDVSLRRLFHTGGQRVAEIIATIAASPAPFVVHGADGAWRVGFVTATLLGVLGVTDSDITRDHALSTAPLGQPCERESMQWLLDEMRRHHGSVAGYVLDHGLPPEVLHDLRAILVV